METLAEVILVVFMVIPVGLVARDRRNGESTRDGDDRYLAFVMFPFAVLWLIFGVHDLQHGESYLVDFILAAVTGITGVYLLIRKRFMKHR